MDGVELIPLRYFEDERGWFLEVRRDSRVPKHTVQTNVSFSRRGVIRGLHYHDRGQDDLFVCLTGMARVVVLDRMSGERFTVDIGEENPPKETEFGDTDRARSATGTGAASLKQIP